MTYPDSVNLVNPPKTTIPKTLVALPSSQNATDLWLIFGKLDFLPEVSASAALAAAESDAARLNICEKGVRYLAVKLGALMRRGAGAKGEAPEGLRRADEVA